jgi:hypothetical protein
MDTKQNKSRYSKLGQKLVIPIVFKIETKPKRNIDAKLINFCSKIGSTTCKPIVFEHNPERTLLGTSFGCPFDRNMYLSSHKRINSLNMKKNDQEDTFI